MKRIVLLFLFSSLFASLAAQQRTSTLRGTILDAANDQPLQGAMILVDSTHHAIADQRGSFTLTVPRKESRVDIIFLGYGTDTRTVDINQATVNLGTIRLKEEGRSIDAVVVTGQSNMAIQKGDTTQFNAAAFKTNPDATAGDLVSKLPGATVEDGSVTVQGETVKRAYVDGKLFFGDDVMAAMQNLPADAIESIQMFDEMSDEAKFVGFDDGSRSRALNIVTKHKVNRSYTGRLEAGYGLELDKDPDGDYQNRYIVSGNVNMFTDKHRWSLNGTANNMNRANRGDGFQGGGGGGMRGGGLRTINSIGLNYSGTWNPKLKFNASYSYNQNRSTTDSWSTQDYYTGDRFLRDTTYSKSKANAHQANVRLEYEAAKDRIFFRANGSANDSHSATVKETSTWLGENLSILNDPDIYRYYSQSGDGTDYSFNGNLIWTRKLGEKAGRTLTIGASGRLNDSDSDATSEEISISDVESQTHLITVADEKGYQIGGRLSYAEPLSPRSRLMATYRVSYDDSEKMIVARDLYSGIIDDSRSNTYSQNYLSHTGEIGYSYNSERFRASGNIAYQTSERQRQQDYPEVDDPSYNRSFNSWQPFVNMRYMVDKSKYFEFRYNGRSSLPSLENLQEVIRTSDGITLNVGNPDLKQSYSHSFNLRYNTSNVEKSTNFWSFIDAGLTQDNVSYLTEFFDEATHIPEYNYDAKAGSQLRIPVNMDGAAYVRSMGGYSFTLRKLGLNINLMGGYEYNRTPSYTYEKSSDENLLNYANTHGGNFRVGFVSNISQNVDFDISSFTRLSYAYNSAMENRRTWNENVTARVNVILLSAITWNTDFSWRYQHVMGDRGSTTNSYVWNMGVGYKFLRRRTAEFRVTMYDLLNQSQKAPRSSFGDTYESTSWTRSMGRYVMGTLSFRFNSMNKLGNSGNRSGDSDGGERRMGPGGPPPGGGMRPGGGMGHGGF